MLLRRLLLLLLTLIHPPAPVYCAVCEHAARNHPTAPLRRPAEPGSLYCREHQPVNLNTYRQRIRKPLTV